MASFFVFITRLFFDSNGIFVFIIGSCFTYCDLSAEMRFALCRFRMKVIYNHLSYLNVFRCMCSEHLRNLFQRPQVYE